MLGEHYKGKIAQKALIVKDGKVLITRDSRDNCFELPGGRLDAGEEPMSGILREIREELGIEAYVKRILSVQKMFHGRDKEDMIVIFYEALMKNEDAEFKVDSEEVAEMQWVDVSSYATYSYHPLYKEALEDYFEQKSL